MGDPKQQLPSREDRLMAGLAYPFWFVVFPLVYMTPDKRNDPFLKSHTYQGAILGMSGVVGLSILRGLLSLAFRWFILLDVFLYPVLRLAEYLVLALGIYGAIWALQGKYANLPYLSKFVQTLDQTETATDSDAPS